MATLQRSRVCLSTSRNCFLFHLRQTFVWVSIKASFLQRNQSWLEIEASPNFFQFHHHEKNPTSSLAASKSKLLQIASNEISSRLPINVVLFTKIFFVVLSWGIRCTAFAKSIAQHYMGSISNTVHELSSNERTVTAIDVSREIFLWDKKIRSVFQTRGRWVRSANATSVLCRDGYSLFHSTPCSWKPFTKKTILINL